MEEQELNQKEVLEETQEENAESIDCTNQNQEEHKDNKKGKFKNKKVDKEKEELRIANLELKEKVLRITAEMQNMRRRYDTELQSQYKYDGFDLVEKLLPIIDNFERAMSVKQEGMEKFLDGFKMIHTNLVEILNGKGIQEINALGQEFNPNIMNAVLTDSDINQANNIVLEVLQKGYMYNDKIIRPAMVKVNEIIDDEQK